MKMEPSRVHALACLSLVIGLASLTACQSTVISPGARIATQSVAVNQVEDAAIWIHPTDPSKSILFITNKAHGMEIHDFDGILLKHYEDGRQLAGVDVLYDIQVGTEKVDLLVAASPSATPAQNGIRIWKIIPDKRRLTEITAGGNIPVLDNTEPLGIACYHSRKTGHAYFFVTNEDGKIEQYQLTISADTEVAATCVRQFSLPGKVKAGVVDDESGAVYFAYEDEGVYRFDAEPTGPTTGELIIKPNDYGLVPDYPGLTLYQASNGKGYFIVVSQSPKGQQSSLGIFERQPPYRYVQTVSPAINRVGGIFSSSGIAVTNRPTNSKFPRGVLAAKNRITAGATEDYKLYAWPDIAGTQLTIDPTWSPRVLPKPAKP